MKRNRFIILMLLLSAVIGASAQKAERDYIRKGNRAYKDSTFVDAEINYRKALDVNPSSATSMYNLGNSLALQQKFQEAMEQYQNAARFETNKDKLAQIHHNSGVLFQAGKKYKEAIEHYKESLRNNPKDHATRYNLALCQKLLEDQQQDQQDQDQNQEQQQDKQEQEQQQDQEQQQQDQQNQDQQESQPEEQKENEMSKENAEQMLNSVMQDEKDVQDKVKKQQQILQGGRLDKNW